MGRSEKSKAVVECARDPGAPFTRMWNRVSLKAVIWIVLTVLLFGSTSLLYPRTTLDSPASTYIGQVILEGGAPYKDAWDLRAPGVYFAYALQIALLGKSAVALRAFDLLWQIATAIALYFIGLRLSGRRSTGVVAGWLYFVVYYSQNFSAWAQPDGFLNLWMAMGVLAALRALESGRARDWALAGAAVGVAAVFKAPYGIFGVALFSAACSDKRMRAAAVLRYGLAQLVGFAVPLLLCVWYFQRHGALKDLILAQFVVAPVYVARIREAASLSDFPKSELRPVLIPMYVMAVAGLSRFVRAALRRESLGMRENLLVAWFLVGVLVIFLHGSFLEYHYVPLLAPLAVLSAGAFESLAKSVRERRPREWQVALLACALLVALPAMRLGQHVVHAKQALTSTQSEDIWVEPGQYIRERTQPNERIFVWGNAPAVYVHADRRAACRFLPTAYLSLRSKDFDFQKTCLEELRANSPTYFVLITHGSITPGLPDALPMLEEFGELKQFVREGYHYEHHGERYVLYRRNAGN